MTSVQKRPSTDELSATLSGLDASATAAVVEALDRNLAYVEALVDADAPKLPLALCEMAAICVIEERPFDHDRHNIECLVQIAGLIAAHNGLFLDKVQATFGLHALRDRPFSAKTENPDSRVRNVTLGEIHDCFQSSLWDENGLLPVYHDRLIASIFTPMSYLSDDEAGEYEMLAEAISQAVTEGTPVKDPYVSFDYSSHKLGPEFALDSPTIWRVDRSRIFRSDVVITVFDRPFVGLGSILESTHRSGGLALVLMTDPTVAPPFVSGNPAVLPLPLDGSVDQEVVNAVNNRIDLLKDHRDARIARYAEFSRSLTQMQSSILERFGHLGEVSNRRVIDITRTIDDYALATSEDHAMVEGIAGQPSTEPLRASSAAVGLLGRVEASLSADEYLLIRDVCAEYEDPSSRMLRVVEKCFGKLTAGVRRLSIGEIRAARREVLADEEKTEG